MNLTAEMLLLYKKHAAAAVVLMLGLVDKSVLQTLCFNYYSYKTFISVFGGISCCYVT